MQFFSTALVSLGLAAPALAQQVTGSGPLGPHAPVSPSRARELPVQSYDRPGSLLVFPEYDNRIGRGTFLTVTNTRTSGSGVRIRYVYVSDGCQTYSRIATLTPGDTRTVLTTADGAPTGHGFVYVYAERLAHGITPISHNWLVGHAVQTDNVAAFDYGQSPVAFRALGADDDPTDVDGDGIRDLDGIEYARAPDRVLVPAFFGQSTFRTSELILIGLSGGTQYTTQVLFHVFNDNEEVFTATYAFPCHERVPLTTVSQIFANTFLQQFTNHDPSETIGATTLESGWFSVDGDVAFSIGDPIDDPAVLAFLIRTSGGTFAFEAPFWDGVQDNGDLLPTGLSGD